MNYRALVPAAILLACLAAWPAQADSVIAISGLDQLNEVAKKHDFLVLEAYAPWCGHCKRLEPEYAKAADALKGHDPPITLAKVDATLKENEDIKKKFDVKGFPTIKIIKGGNLERPLAYAGPRDEAGIVTYLKKQVLPAYAQLSSSDEIEAAKKDAEVLVLAYFESNSSAEFNTFAEVADQLRNDMDFRYVTDRALVEAHGCGADCASPFVVMYKRDEEEAPRYEGAFKGDVLRAWMEAKSVPLVLKYNPQGMKYVQKAFASSAPRLVAVVKEASAELLEQLKQASKASDNLFVILAVEKDSKRLIDFFGITVGEGLTLLMDDGPKAAKYLRADAKPSDIPEFLREWQEGALERWLKSEAPPADNSGPVRVVTGNTFEQEVANAGKDVFIEFYAPWCGHCKKLAPIWEEVGEAFKDDDAVVIAKMDATANDIPHPKIKVRGYPTLFFITAKGDVIPFSGTREKKDLIKFVSDKRTTPGKGDEDEVDDEDKDEL